MKKINNFGCVEYDNKNSEVKYSYYDKRDGKWVKCHDSAYLKNEVFIPNAEAVGEMSLGRTPQLRKDFFGNPILTNVTCDFFDKNPPEIVKQCPEIFSSDIHPTTKFLSESFEFDADKDEIPPLGIHFVDIETVVDDKGFLQGWYAGPDYDGRSRGGITLIASFDLHTQRNTMFGINPYTDSDPLPKNTEYIFCEDEATLLRKYMQYLKATDPDILTGWNFYDFDLSYILNRMILQLGPNSLHRFGNGSAWIDNRKRRIYLRGINVIDYMPLYKKFELTPRRSYALAAIVEVEGITVGGKGKHKYKGSIKDFYENDWNGFVRYCAQDAMLVYELDNKKKLLDTFITCCYMSGIPFNQAISADVSWLRIHDSAIYRHCQKLGIELPDRKDPIAGEEKFAGAYVMKPDTGVYNFVTVFDVASLYPSCMRALNVSMDTYRGQVISGDVVTQKGPYTVEFYSPFYSSLGEYGSSLLTLYNKHHVEQTNVNKGQLKTASYSTFQELRNCLKKFNYSIAANGAIFSQDKRGVIPALLDDWIAIRKKNKKLYFDYKLKHQETGEVKYKRLADRYNTIQQVYKIRLNSLYGFIGSKYSRFFQRKVAEAITTTGQYIIKSTMKALKKSNILYKAIYCDTDSLFFDYGKLLKMEGIDITNGNENVCVERCLEIDKVIKNIIDTHLQNICTNVMLTDQLYDFESEEVISRMLITSKKKYIARIAYDKTTNQYLEDEFVIKGMSFKKSNLSDNIKAFLKEVTIKIMDGSGEDEISALLKEKFEELPTMSIDDIAYVQGVRNLQKYEVDSNVVINSPTDTVSYFAHKCPYHISGAIALNTLIDYDARLRTNMTKVCEGEKGKIIFVIPKNLLGVKAITLSQGSEWNPNLFEYFSLDVEYMFQRLIIGPLQPAFDAVGFRLTMDSILGFHFLDCENKFAQICLF